MRLIRITLIAAALLTPAALAPAQGLTVADGRFQLDGRDYKGFGVNYHDAFLRTLRDGSDTSYSDGFDDLAGRDIPFARVNFGGFFPSDMDLYQSDPGEYFRRLDGVVGAAEASGVGLVPSLFWNSFTIPDLAGEPASAWGDADSQTRALARRYATDVVTRYQDSPAILMWEFGNEFNLKQDLPDQDPDAGVAPGRGTPEQRTEADRMSSDDVRSAIADIGGVIRNIDPSRPYTTGHSVARPAAQGLRETGSFVRDTVADFELVTAEDHAAADSISVHAYHHSLLGIPPDQQNEPSRRFADEPGATYEEVLNVLQDLADETGKPLFVGEFGVADAFDFAVEDDGDPDNDDEQRLRKLLDAYVDQDVQMAALWVYDFKQPNADIRAAGLEHHPGQQSRLPARHPGRVQRDRRPGAGGVGCFEPRHEHVAAAAGAMT